MFIDIDILRAFIERSGVVAEDFRRPPLYMFHQLSRMSGTDSDWWFKYIYIVDCFVG
jgi:hypothetical protein